MISKARRSQIGALFRFATVGFMTAALYALILIVCVEMLGYRSFVGAAIAYMLAVGFNYLAHYTWTYHADTPHRSTAPRYLVTTVVLFFINVMATAALPGLLGVSYAVVQGLLMALAALATFITLSKWVFSSRGKSACPTTTDI